MAELQANGSAAPASDGAKGQADAMQPAEAKAGTAAEAAPAPPRAPARHRLELQQIALALLAAWVAVQAVLVAALRLWGWELALSLVGGAALGLGLTALYHLNLKKKAERNSRLGAIPGAKGLTEVLHFIPTWITFRDSEKVEWLNAILEKVWPYYDAAICAAVKAQVEPLFDQYKPGFIKRIYFQKLTFGDDPFRVEAIKVDKSRADQVQLQVFFRWAGDANIFLAIETLGGTATRMVPKVSDLAVSGVLRITLAPLVPEIPGFGAAVVSLMRQPVVRFQLNFGSALGGSYSASAVRAWLDPFIRQTLAGMLVWPERLVVPLLPPEVTGPLDDLMLRHKGVLQLDVLEARGLTKMDTVGSADPFVEAWTTPKYVDKTKVVKNSLTPSWNQRLWLMVQEPDSQMLRLACYDWDAVNVGELFRLNLLKGAASVFGAKTLMGRAMFRVSLAAEQPARPVEKWLPLGKDDFNELAETCGEGQGEIRVRLTYWPFELITGHTEAGMGAVLITLISCSNLVPMDRPLGTSDPYVRFKLNGEVRQSRVISGELNPKWETVERFDWFKVPCDELLRVKVMDFDRFSSDEVMGEVEIDLMEEVAKAPGGDITRTWDLEDVPSDAYTGEPLASTITMRIRWIPFK